MEGGREGRREGGSEGGREGGKEGRREGGIGGRDKYTGIEFTNRQTRFMCTT